MPKNKKYHLLIAVSVTGLQEGLHFTGGLDNTTD